MLYCTEIMYFSENKNKRLGESRESRFVNVLDQWRVVKMIEKTNLSNFYLSIGPLQ